MADQDIPELKREQLGSAVRGKFYQEALKGTRVVVLAPELAEVFPTSEAVNNALAGLLAIASEAKKLTTPTKRAPKKRATA